MLWSPTDHSSVATISGAVATRNSTSGGTSLLVRSDTSQSSGVRYVEQEITEVGNGAFVPMEVGCASGAAALGSYPGSSNEGVSYRPNGSIVKNAVATGVSGSTYTTGDVIGMLLDFSARTVSFRKNGGSFTTPLDVTSLGTDIFAACSLGNGDIFSSVTLKDPVSYPSGSSPWVEAVANPYINVVEHGDSMSLTGGVQRTYLPRLIDLLTVRAKWTRCGINGASWAYAWPSAGYPYTLTEDALLRVDPARTGTMPDWLIVFAGTNGFILGAHSAATEYANFQTYIAARLAAGWQANRIVVCTMLPRTGLNESTRSTYNASLISGAATYGYRVSRLDLIPSIGSAGQNLNTTWFYDGTHPTDAGHQLIAQDLAGIIGSTLPAVPVGTFSSYQAIGNREDLRH